LRKLKMSWTTEHFNLAAEIARQDEPGKKYILAAPATFVQWLAMLVAFPASNFSVTTCRLIA
jgi:hypothetical protein